MKVTSQQLPERNRFLLRKCCKYECKTVCTPGHSVATTYSYQTREGTDLDRPRGFQEVEAPRFQDSSK
jgi:hypothetical protein